MAGVLPMEPTDRQLLDYVLTRYLNMSRATLMREYLTSASRGASLDDEDSPAACPVAEDDVELQHAKLMALMAMSGGKSLGR